MPGKPYTMREMKGIVEYIKEHKTYGEIRGRKMWMDLASSDVTSRTWQSLKETFLKRILPDIYNPYYKLSMNEIRSFRTGVEIPDKAKLDFTLCDSASNGNENINGLPNPSVQGNKDIKSSGEDIKCLKVSSNRESVETVILETNQCSKSDEEKSRSNKVKTVKSLRDCITYSDPITPLLQDIIDDFDSESDPTESDIVLKTTEKNTGNKSEHQEESKTKCAQVPVTSNLSLENELKSLESVDNKDVDHSNDINKSKKSLKSSKSQVKNKDYENNENNLTAELTSNKDKGDMEKMEVVVCVPDLPVTPMEDHVAKNSLSATNTFSTMDSLLPNNQEGLQNKKDSPVAVLIPEAPRSNSTPQKLKNKTKKSVQKEMSSPESDSVLTRMPANAMRTTNKSKNITETHMDTDKFVKNMEKLNRKNDIPSIDTVEEKEINKMVTRKSNENVNSSLSQQSTNPCLQSISLFATQFLTLESDKSDKSEKSHSSSKKHYEIKQPLSDVKPAKGITSEQNTEKVIKKNVFEDLVQTDIVVLHSHSDSDGQQVIDIVPTKTNNQVGIESLKSRNKMLDNLFGNSSGGANKRRRNNSFRKETVMRRHDEMRENSSEWTSESESEYDSPPRSRYRHARKHLRPRSSRIMCLEQEGGLFVACGNKVYPLVRDGKVLKNCLNYMPGSDEEQDTSYWKMKYIEERKRTMELTRMLQNVPDIDDKNCAQPENSDSPILPSKKAKKLGIQANNATTIQDLKDIENAPVALEKPNEPTNKEKIVKIKIAKNDEEVSLEGHWQNIQPIMSQVMHMLNKKDAQPEQKTPQPEQKIPQSEQKTLQSEEEEPERESKQRKPQTKQKKPQHEREKPQPEQEKPLAERKERLRASFESSSTPIEILSGNTTPSVGQNEEVQNKISEIEDAIFKKIEEYDTLENEPEAALKNVTERRKRSRRTSKKSLSPSPQAKKRMSRRKKGSAEETGAEVRTDNEIIVNEAKLTLLPNDSDTEMKSKTVDKDLDMETKLKPKRGRPPKQSPKDTKKDTVPRPHKISNNRVSKSRDQSSETDFDEDSKILYKFPSPEPENVKPKNKKSITSVNQQKDKHHKSSAMSLLKEISINRSIESSQGYQDSDYTPINVNPRRKRKLSLPAYTCSRKQMTHRYNKRQSFKLRHNDASSDSSNSSFNIPTNGLTIVNSTVSSGVYRSESYDLLNIKTRNYQCLEKISETSPCPNEVNSDFDINNSILSPASQHIIGNSKKTDPSNSQPSNTEFGNSSSISLPPSPEISLVENISIDKNDICDLPTMNDMEVSENQVKSSLDRPVSSMELETSINTSNKKHVEDTNISQALKRNITDTYRHDLSGIKGASVSQTFLNQMKTVNLQESLTLRLENLLLESAKKMVANKDTLDDMTQNNKPVNNVLAKENPKTKSRKRCSTPRKRKETKKFQIPSVDRVIEEEQMEFCNSGRKSCPPVISVLCAEKPTDLGNTKKKENRANTDKNNPIQKTKEIIKVKILRPKNKAVPKTKKKLDKINTKSVLTDSGIHDLMFNTLIQNHNESLDLIHNHSETCILATECMSSSVEFVENMSKSIISLNTSSMPLHEDKENFKCSRNVRKDDITPEFFSNDAQDATNLLKGDKGETQHIPLASGSSLLTDDLSYENPMTSPLDCHLLSEEETKNPESPCDRFNPPQCSMRSSYGANLKQLFPIACAVPDLSTITEASKEMDENSQKTSYLNINTKARNKYLNGDSNLCDSEDVFSTCFNV